MCDFLFLNFGHVFLVQVETVYCHTVATFFLVRCDVKAMEVATLHPDALDRTEPRRTDKGDARGVWPVAV